MALFDMKNASFVWVKTRQQACRVSLLRIDSILKPDREVLYAYRRP